MSAPSLHRKLSDSLRYYWPDILRPFVDKLQCRERKMRTVIITYPLHNVTVCSLQLYPDGPLLENITKFGFYSLKSVLERRDHLVSCCTVTRQTIQQGCIHDYQCPHVFQNTQFDIFISDSLCVAVWCLSHAASEDQNNLQRLNYIQLDTSN